MQEGERESYGRRAATMHFPARTDRLEGFVATPW